MQSGSEEHRAFMRAKFPDAFELFYAVFEGDVTDVRDRLRAGDDPNARGMDGRTPITFALASPRDLPKADLLWDAGARIDLWDHFGLHPIHWTTRSVYRDDVHCLQWLLDHGVGPNEAVRSSTELQFHPIGWHPLHIAVGEGSLAAASLLIERGADVNARAADDATALHVAAGQYRVYKRLMRLLLDEGADLNTADRDGATPLHLLAAGHGRYRKTAVELLRNRGARLDVIDACGRRPVDRVPDGLPATIEMRRLLRPTVDA